MSTSDSNNQPVPENAVTESPDRNGDDARAQLSDTLIKWLETPPRGAFIPPTPVAAAPPEIKPFEILEPICEGGMGILWKARHTGIDKLVALKILNPQNSDAQAVMRFQHEAKTLSRLSHPDIATVYDFGICNDGKQPFMAIEYIEGRTLNDVIAERKRLTFEEALPIFIRVCRALAHAHRKDIIHRDVQPGNIMLSRSKNGNLNVKVIDFGIAKSLNWDSGNKLTRHGGWIGSPFYMSPEQSRGDQVGKETDMYSIGCVMFHCLSGKLPFEGKTVLETIAMHQDRQPPLLTEVVPDLKIPIEIDIVLSRLMAKRPEERFESMEEVAEILEELGYQQEDTNRKHRNKKYLIAAMVCLVLGLITAYGGKLYNDAQSITTNSPLNEEVLDQLGNDNRKLFLNKPGITDYQLSLVKDYSDAVCVNLAGASITDDGLRYLKGKKLRELALDNTKIRSLKELDCRDTLEALFLKKTNVDDDTIKTLAGYKKLEFLDVSKTNVTAKGLIAIKPLPLYSVTMQPVTEQELQELQESFPFCRFNKKPEFIDRLVKQCDELVAQGRQQEVVIKLKYWKKIAETRRDTSFSIFCSSMLASYLDEMGRSNEAEKHWDDAVKLGEATKNYAELNRVYVTLFSHSIQLGKLDRAVQLAWKRIENYENWMGNEDIVLALNVTSAARALAMKGRYVDAMNLFNESLAMQRRIAKAHKKPHIHVLFTPLEVHSTTLALLAQTQIDLHKYKEARPNITLAIQELEELVKTDRNINCKINLTLAYLKLSKIELAEGNVKQATELRDKILKMVQDNRIDNKLVLVRTLELQRDLLKIDGKTADVQSAEENIKALKGGRREFNENISTEVKELDEN